MMEEFIKTTVYKEERFKGNNKNTDISCFHVNILEHAPLKVERPKDDMIREALVRVTQKKICQELVKHIQDLISLGVKLDTILLKSHEWSKEQGHTDLNNQAYFVTLKDIENIRTYMFPQKDLVIVLQTPSMRDNLQEYEKDIVFMDATHGINQYGFPLFTLVVRDSHGHGIPVAYIILGNEKQATLQLALEKLKPTFSVPPR
ncbi:dITP/XTP pyrophosphatase [Labeo rohita]|uniref:DITP/XTP pyrophosphatase n=1 Tax=Labeo rohita TaxID=84645 RepID=A0ABQ8L0H1_LABRO|nr:dITP/XTP pyrophosphatase [Labeo rohita]